MFFFDYFDSADRARLARVEFKLDQLLRAITEQKGMLMANQAELNNLATKISAMETASQGATALLQELSTLIRDAADDPQEIRALADRVEAAATTLGDAVAANTPGGKPSEPEEPAQDDEFTR